MSNKAYGLRATLLLLVLGVVALTPAFAGSAVIGSVAGSMNATVSGVALRPNTTLFSGDSLQVKDGVAIVAVGKMGRMVFGRDTVASFLRDTNEVTVLLGQGSVSLFHPDDSVALSVKAGDVSVTPAAGFKTLGEIAMLNGSLVITTKEGTLVADNGDQKISVAKGKTLTMRLSRAPQGAAGAAAKTGPHISGAVVAEVASVTLSGVSVVTGAVAMSRAGDAKTAAATASSNAAAALSAASAAATAASAAASAASAAAAGVQTVCSVLSTAYPPLQACAD